MGRTTGSLTHSAKGMEQPRSILSDRRIPREPNWVTGDLAGYGASVEVLLSGVSDRTGELEAAEPLQQSDLLRPLLMDIAEHGLSHAYDGYSARGRSAKSGGEPEQTQYPKDVIVVGAGITGMAAAYELKRVGHRVTILEAQNRAGGRVRTYDHHDGFAPGLHVDGEFRGVSRITTANGECSTFLASAAI